MNFNIGDKVRLIDPSKTVIGNVNAHAHVNEWFIITFAIFCKGYEIGNLGDPTIQVFVDEDEIELINGPHTNPGPHSHSWSALDEWEKNAQKHINNLTNDISKQFKRKCTCGAHAVGSNMHSDYCDLYESEV